MIALIFLCSLLQIICRTSFGKTVDTNLASDDESRLKDYLFKYRGYNRLIRPVVNLSDIVTVQFELALIQLINVEEKRQVMKTNVWIRMTWHDYQLTWDPPDFGGIDVARVSPDVIWRPDIVLFNNADGHYEVLWKSNTLLEFDGDILWIPPAIYESSCKISVDYFPFDVQTCELRFGSWTFNSRQISLQFMGDKKIDLQEYWQSGTWDIVSCPGKIINGTSKSDGFNTPIIIYEVTIRRKTLFYTVILILPCLLISLLTVCVFYLPVDDHHKMTLTISILLALIVFFLLISKLLPPSSVAIPLISKYLLFTFIVNIVVIVITVIIINFNYRTPRTHYMAPWVKKVFIVFLPVLLGMNRPSHIEAELLEQKRITAISPGLRRRQKRINDFDASLTKTFRQIPPSSKRIIKMIDSQISMNLLYDRDNREPIKTDVWRSQGRIMPSTSFSKISNNAYGYPFQTSQDESSLNDSIDINESTDESLNDPSELRFFKGFEITTGVREAMLSINFISTHTETQDEFSMGKQDWQFVASVLDRLMLIIFSAVTIIGTAVLFLKTPYFQSFSETNANKCA